MSAPRCLQKPSEIKQYIVDAHEAFIFDMDGVLWKVNSAIDGAATALQYVKAQNKSIFFATNNSLLRADKYVEKLKRLGLGDFPVDSVLCSSRAVALYLKHRNFKGRLLVLGPQALVDEINELEGVEAVELAQVENIHPYTMADYDIDMTLDGVAMGFDNSVSYFKIAYATALLNAKPDALFVATNTDHKFPTHRLTLPGTGTFVRALEVATERVADVAGKPSSVILDEILRRNPGLTADKICMIGDNLLTDIKFGKCNQMKTVLVETGVNSRQDLVTETDIYKDAQPDFIIPSVKWLSPTI